MPKVVNKEEQKKKPSVKEAVHKRNTIDANTVQALMYKIYDSTKGTGSLCREDKLYTPEKAKENARQSFLKFGPDRKNLKKSLKEYRKNNPGHSAAKFLTATEAELQERMRHSSLCFDAMMDVAAEAAQKRVCLDETIARMLGKDASLNALRCMWDLMETGKTPEAKDHNEHVVMLMALNEGDITDEQYRQFRVKQLTEKAPNAAEIADNELNDRANALFTLMKKKAEALHKEAEGFEQALQDIMNVQEMDPEKLKKAYKIVDAATCSLLRCGNSAMNDAKTHYGWDFTPEEERWIKTNMDDFGCANDRAARLVSNVANPYFAILDSVELMGSFDKPTLKKGEDLVFSPLARFCHEAQFQAGGELITNIGEVEKDFKTELNRLGMRDARGEEHSLFFKIYKKDGDVLVTKNEVVSRSPISTKVELDAAGDLVGERFRSEIEDFCEMCDARNKWTSSKAFNKMKDELKGLRNTTLSSNPSSEELDRFEKGIEALKKKTEIYLEKKQKDIAKRNKGTEGKNDYEKNRIDFAKKLKAFTEEKLEQLQLVKAHQMTRQKQMAAERDLEAEPQRGRISVKDLDEKFGIQNQASGRKTVFQKPAEQNELKRKSTMG